MTMRLSMTTDHVLALMAPAARADLAAPVLARSLGIAAGDAAGRLARGPGTLATGLSRTRASRAATMLGLLGLRVRVAEGGADVEPETVLFDVALQVADAGLRAGVAVRLARWLDMAPDAVVAGLGRPGGIVVTALDWTAVNGWRRRVRGMCGLQLLVSDPAGATFDLLPWDRPANPARLAPLLRFLRRLGLATCPLTGAVAAGIDRVMVRTVLRRFPDCGLVALNRDFQRFDLVLAGTPMPVRHELASFLAARTALPPQAFARPDRVAGLRIECSLCRADALAFQTDYAAIGLETRLRLVLERGDGPA